MGLGTRTNDTILFYFQIVNRDHLHTSAMSKGRGQWKDRVLDDSDIDRTPEYAEFIKKLQEYHDRRGYVA